MKTLLVIMAHAGVNDLVAKFFPWYERAGVDILGIGRIGSRWPASRQLIGFRDEGQDCYNDGTSQIVRFLSVLEFVMSKPDSPYSDFVLVEWDTIFTKPLPVRPEAWMIATTAGHRNPPFRGSRFFHCPWWLDRVGAAAVLQCGPRMLNAGLTEQGFLDRWIGLMSDLYVIPDADIGGFTRNALDTPEHIAAARAAIKAGAYAVHGCKTEAQLAAITEGL